MNPTNYQLSVVFYSATFHLCRPGELSNELKNEFICGAIDRTGLPTDWTIPARNIVSNRIYPYATIKQWARSNGHFIRRNDMLFSVEFDIMQEFRHRWLDSLRLEFLHKND